MISHSRACTSANCRRQHEIIQLPDFGQDAL
jgi:hypothetical protein